MISHLLRDPNPIGETVHRLGTRLTCLVSGISSWSPHAHRCRACFHPFGAESSKTTPGPHAIMVVVSLPDGFSTWLYALSKSSSHAVFHPHLGSRSSADSHSFFFPNTWVLVNGNFGSASLRLPSRREVDTTYSGIGLDSGDLLLLLIPPVFTVLQRTGGLARKRHLRPDISESIETLQWEVLIGA